jgi:predicted Co/Zn/Cd cation transporter (cation efflux family)
MFAILAAVCFGVAWVIHGGEIAVHSPWIDQTGLMLLGLVFVALHLVRVHGPGNWRSG